MLNGCVGWTCCDRGHDPHQAAARRPGHEGRAGELRIVEKRSQCIEPGSWRKMRAAHWPNSSS